MIWSGMAREGFVVAGWTMPSSASLHLRAALVAFLRYAVTGSGCTTALGKGGL